jgi:hypothetical protein
MVDTSMFSLTLCYAGLTFDGQQFYQYQQKTAITTNHRTQNTTTYGFGNPLLGLGLLFILVSHDDHYLHKMFMTY